MLVHKKETSEGTAHTNATESRESPESVPLAKSPLRSRLIALLSAAVVAAGIITFEGTAHAKITAEYNAAQASARKVGIATTRAEFEALMPQVTDAQNSESDFKQINRAMGEANLGKSWILNAVEGYKLTAEQQKLLDIAKVASTKKGLRFHYNWDNMLVGFPLFGVIRISTEALAANAEAQAYQGHTDAAIQELSQAYKLRDQLAAQPILICQLMAQGLGNRIDSAALGVASTSPALLPSILDLVGKNQSRPSFEKTFKGEVYFAEHIAKLIRSYRDLQIVRSESYDQKFAEQLQSNFGKPLTDFQKRILVDFFNGWVEIFQRYANDPDQLPWLQDQLRDASGTLARKFFSQPQIGIFSSMQENGRLHDKLLRAATGVLKYRNAHGGALPTGIPSEAGPDYKALDSVMTLTPQLNGFSLLHKASNRIFNVHWGFIPDPSNGKRK